MDNKESKRRVFWSDEERMAVGTRMAVVHSTDPGMGLLELARAAQEALPEDRRREFMAWSVVKPTLESHYLNALGHIKQLKASGAASAAESKPYPQAQTEVAPQVLEVAPSAAIVQDEAKAETADGEVIDSQIEQTPAEAQLNYAFIDSQDDALIIEFDDPIQAKDQIVGTGAVEFDAKILIADSTATAELAETQDSMDASKRIEDETAENAAVHHEAEVIESPTDSRPTEPWTKLDTESFSNLLLAETSQSKTETVGNQATEKPKAKRDALIDPENIEAMVEAALSGSLKPMLEAMIEKAVRAAVDQAVSKAVANLTISSGQAEEAFERVSPSSGLPTKVLLAGLNKDDVSKIRERSSPEFDFMHWKMTDPQSRLNSMAKSCSVAILSESLGDEGEDFLKSNNLHVIRYSGSVNRVVDALGAI